MGGAMAPWPPPWLRHCVKGNVFLYYSVCLGVMSLTVHIHPSNGLYFCLPIYLDTRDSQSLNKSSIAFAAIP